MKDILRILYDLGINAGLKQRFDEASDAKRTNFIDQAHSQILSLLPKEEKGIQTVYVQGYNSAIKKIKERLK